MDGDGRWVHVSRKYVENNDISFPKCDVTGHPHLKAGTMAIYGSSKYRRVGISALKKPGLFSACGCCGNWWEKEMVKVYEEIGSTPLCTSCMMKELIGKIIHPFNHKDYPKPIYTKQFRMGHTVDKNGLVCATNQKSEVQATRLFGWEAETEIDKKSAIAKGVNRAVIAMAVRDTLGKDYVCMKEDGTLTMNGKYSDDRGDGRMYAGFEIVSAPADMEAHRTRIAKLPETAGYKMLRAFDTETCGFHVHVSRASLTSLQIGRMLYAINHKNWARFVHKVACRGSARFCAYYDKKLTDALHPERVISKEEEGSYNKSRRVALNIANKDTVEFRIFKGTVNPRHIMRNIEFCDAICDFCLPCERSLKDLADYREFIKFVDQNRKKWPMLAEWFAYQKMISVKKIKKGIDPSKLTIRPDLIEEADVDKQEPNKEKDPPF
jgi:hypothetical protein